MDYLSSNKILITDIDNTLLGDDQCLESFLKFYLKIKDKIQFGIATGRRIDNAVKVLDKWGVPKPSLYITSVGGEIHYGDSLEKDLDWVRHLKYEWEPDEIYNTLNDLPGLTLQPKSEQREFKVSYYIDPKKSPNIDEINGLLEGKNIQSNIIYSHGELLDILPIRGSKGLAVNFVSQKWNIPKNHIIVSGDSGNDEEMLIQDTLGIVVGNYSEELEHLKGKKGIYFAKAHYAKGIIEGIKHYSFI